MKRISMDMIHWQRLLTGVLLGLILAFIAKRKHRRAGDWLIASSIPIIIFGGDMFILLLVILFLLKPLCKSCKTPMSFKQHKQSYQCDRCGCTRKQICLFNISFIINIFRRLSQRIRPTTRTHRYKRR